VKEMTVAGMPAYRNKEDPSQKILCHANIALRLYQRDKNRE
jgi:hypothetical protein